MKKVQLFESFVSEGFEVHYSDGVRAAKKFKSEKDAMSFTKEKIASGKCKEIAIYKDGAGFHSTADTEAVVAWWGDGSYLDNVSKKDSKLAAKKIDESVVTEATKFKSTKNFIDFCEEIEGMPEAAIKKIMGKEYIDTPGGWADEKDDYDDIEDYMISNMGRKGFEELQDWWEANVAESVVTEAKAKGLDWIIGELGDKPRCYDVADFVYTNYDKVTGLRKSMRNDEMDFPEEIMDVVDHYGLDIDEFTDCYGMAAESLKVTEGEVNVFDELGPELEALRSKISGLMRKSTDDKWTSALGKALSAVSTLDRNLSQADSKLGVVLTEGVVSIKGGRIIAHKVLNKLVDMDLIPVRKKTEDLLEVIAKVISDAKMESVEINEGAMSDIDLMAKEAKDFKSFVKEFKKEYKNMDAGSATELEAWLQSVYDGAKTNESVVSEAIKPAGLSKAETKKVAETYAKAISKHDGCKCTVNAKSLEEDSFDLDIDGEEYAGGSYMITLDGDVINAALPEKPVYGQIDSTVDEIIKNLKK